MNRKVKGDVIKHLQQFVTEERWRTMNDVLSKRTRHLTVVLEDLYQPHNASAVLRSCDCFGVQDVHIIENENKFDPSKGVTIGSDQWLSLNYYNKQEGNNTIRCYERLRNEGYQLIATTPHTDDITIDDISTQKKTALIFGSELTGLSEAALTGADGYARIPMVGFSESFNISVSAALSLYELSNRIRKSKDLEWSLTEEEKLDLRYKWLKNSIRAADKIIDRYLKEKEKGKNPS
ncbi:RNA methyltransferase [Aliifodinibius salicampi]|uniref:tRNA (guanosine(18)-2'-O)-methyltransferase n=1 Tax=Fodinibius salicampi TaxID=1920655 RepID=A0ABT3PWZ8_9BACT|nr:RNA methyltransferase [Fodinibius salicampi]MCW9712367.1 RNA methyltransferase [Fodinibius salicampi]